MKHFNEVVQQKMIKQFSVLSFIMQSYVRSQENTDLVHASVVEEPKIPNTLHFFENALGYDNMITDFFWTVYVNRENNMVLTVKCSFVNQFNN